MCESLTAGRLKKSAYESFHVKLMLYFNMWFSFTLKEVITMWYIVIMPF